ncbi:MAG: DUF3251 domain-containing protein [Desulfitobacterium hafniense]|nr:DUF3251 domain-containing protein [Desulfitobacterium hafniense]
MKKGLAKTALISTLIISLLLVGCGTKSANTSSPVEDQAKTIADLTKKVTDLENQINLIHISEETKGRALDLSGNAGFMKIETDLGMFFVSVKQVEPYLDGVQVTLSIGNPMNATFNGLKMKIEYGTHNALDFSANGTDKYNQWKKTLKEKSIDLNTEIKPGTWNTAKFTIPAISPNDFGYLCVEINSDSVSLLQP